MCAPVHMKMHRLLCFVCMCVYVSTRVCTPLCDNFCLYIAQRVIGFCVHVCDEPCLTALGEHSRPRLPMRLSEAVSRGHTKLHINLLEENLAPPSPECTTALPHKKSPALSTLILLIPAGEKLK